MARLRTRAVRYGENNQQTVRLPGCEKDIRVANPICFSRRARCPFCALSRGGMFFSPAVWASSRAPSAAPGSVRRVIIAMSAPPYDMFYAHSYRRHARFMIADIDAARRTFSTCPRVAAGSNMEKVLR